MPFQLSCYIPLCDQKLSIVWSLTTLFHVIIIASIQFCSREHMPSKGYWWAHEFFPFVLRYPRRGGVVYFLSKYANKVQQWIVDICLVNNPSVGFKTYNPGQGNGFDNPFGDDIYQLFIFHCSLQVSFKRFLLLFCLIRFIFCCMTSV